MYFQTTEPFLVMSGFCVYSVASALFMFPALYTFYTPALQIYAFEHADGSGRATDLVIQPFVRFISMAFFPVIICAGVLYVLVGNVDKQKQYVYVHTHICIYKPLYANFISWWILIVGMDWSFSKWLWSTLLSTRPGLLCSFGSSSPSPSRPSVSLL